jgi:hypothetical protein
MIKKVFGLAVAGAIAVAFVGAASGPVVAQQVKKSFAGRPASNVVVARPGHRHSNTGRNIGIGIGAVVIGTIIASEVARANSGSGMSCRALERRCDDGQNWACRRLDVREDC